MSSNLLLLTNDLVKTLNLTENVNWLGEVSYSKMAQALRKSHLYLQTSWHESQGMAVLEAMACGLPVIGTPVGVTADEACMPAVKSATALAAQAVEIFGNEERYRRLRKFAKLRVEEAFSLPVTRKHFQRLYQQAIEDSRR